MAAHACLTSQNTCLAAFLAPSAVHLQAGATAGFPSSPALWEFLCMRYFRFIGLKCYQIVVLMILLLPGKCKGFFSVLRFTESSSWMMWRYVFCVVVMLAWPSLLATLPIETPANKISYEGSSENVAPSLMRILSLPIKILSQGWFFPSAFIPANKKSLPRMIFPFGFHPCQ